MTYARGAICFGCLRWRGETCAAFPKGIPAEIMFDGFDHRTPLRGETLLFEPDPARPEKLAAYEHIKLANELAQQHVTNSERAQAEY